MGKGAIIAIVVVGSVLLLCVGGGAAIVYFVFRATAPMVQSADQFLVQIAEGKVDDAYNSAATGLKSVQTARGVRGLGQGHGPDRIRFVHLEQSSDYQRPGQR